MNPKEPTILHLEAQSLNFGSIQQFTHLNENEFVIQSKLQSKNVYYFQKNLNNYDLSDDQLFKIAVKKDNNNLLMIYKNTKTNMFIL